MKFKIILCTRIHKFLKIIAKPKKQKSMEIFMANIKGVMNVRKNLIQRSFVKGSDPTMIWFGVSRETPIYEYLWPY